MHKDNCKCSHHLAEKIMMILVWIAGVLFLWSGLKGVSVWGYDPLFYAWSVVVLSFMVFGMELCGCCGSSKMGMIGGNSMCSHEDDCKCGNCDRCC